jgi:hypothetical protein
MNPEIIRRLAAHHQAELARDMSITRHAGPTRQGGRPLARRTRRPRRWLRLLRPRVAG